MKKKVIYLVHIDVVDDDFNEMSDDEIKKLHAKDPSRVLRFDNLYDFANDWNNNSDEMFDPEFSYIRIIEE